MQRKQFFFFSMVAQYFYNVKTSIFILQIVYDIFKQNKFLFLSFLLYFKSSQVIYHPQNIRKIRDTIIVCLPVSRYWIKLRVISRFRIADPQINLMYGYNSQFYTIFSLWNSVQNKTAHQLPFFALWSVAYGHQS